MLAVVPVEAFVNVLVNWLSQSTVLAVNEATGPFTITVICVAVPEQLKTGPTVLNGIIVTTNVPTVLKV